MFLFDLLSQKYFLSNFIHQKRRKKFTVQNRIEKNFLNPILFTNLPYLLPVLNLGRQDHEI